MNTFAVWEDENLNDTISLSATIDDSVRNGRITQITINSPRDNRTDGTATYILSEKETKELISALQARVDGEITAFSGTFNQ